jgi:hypothetical protein
LIKYLSSTGRAAGGGSPQASGGAHLSGRARGPRFSRPPGSDLEAAIRAELGAGEEVLFILSGVGSTMVGTTDRVMVAREGVGFRPRSGMRSYDLGAIQSVAIDGGTQRSGRIVLRLGPLYYQAISMFFDGSQAVAAAEAARQLRIAIGRRREQDRRRDTTDA